MSPSVDNVVTLFVCFWFFVALVVGLALFLDNFLDQNSKALLFLPMLTSLVLPLFGLLSIHYTFYTLIQNMHNPFFFLVYSTYNIPTNCIHRPNFTI